MDPQTIDFDHGRTVFDALKKHALKGVKPYGKEIERSVALRHSRLEHALKTANVGAAGTERFGTISATISRRRRLCPSNAAVLFPQHEQK